MPRKDGAKPQDRHRGALWRADPLIVRGLSVATRDPAVRKPACEKSGAAQSDGAHPNVGEVRDICDFRDLW